MQVNFPEILVEKANTFLFKEYPHSIAYYLLYYPYAQELFSTEQG